MKLAYITRTSVPSMAAQSVQIASMCESFHEILGSDFLIVSPINEENKFLNKPYVWMRLTTSREKPLFYFRFIIDALKIVKGFDADCIFTRDIGVAFIAAILGKKSVYEMHKEPRTRFSQFIFPLIRRMKCVSFVSISQGLADYYIHEYKIHPNRIFVAHDGVFLSKYDKLREVSKQSLRKTLELPDGKIIMHTGSLYEGRGAELFEVMLKHFPDILFVQVGGIESDINKWQGYYKKFTNILFITHVTNERLIQYQMSADMLFFPMTKNNPTWWCTSPMKLFEYLASGVPILGSAIGSSGEVLSDDNSFIIDPSSEASIIEAVNERFSDNEQALQKSNNAVSMVRQSYTWSERSTSILNFINK